LFRNSTTKEIFINFYGLPANAIIIFYVENPMPLIFMIDLFGHVPNVANDLEIRVKC
jgi:hypothetical protein